VHIKIGYCTVQNQVMWKNNVAQVCTLNIWHCAENNGAQGMYTKFWHCVMYNWWHAQNIGAQKSTLKFGITGCRQFVDAQIIM
jgi:hypothetical protein